MIPWEEWNVEETRINLSILEYLDRLQKIEQIKPAETKQKAV